MVILALQFNYIIESLLVGLIATLLGSIIIDLWDSKRKKYRIYAKLESSELYLPKSKSEVSINVNYKGTPIDNALVVLHISLTNDGKEDIKFDTHFSDKIQIACKGYRFLSISADNNRVKPLCELCDNGATLSWDIFKKREIIRLNITAQLIENSSEMIDKVDCFNNLSFDFRSDCIDAIEASHEMTRQDSLWKSQHSISLMKYASMAVICLWFFLFDMYFSSRYDITFNGQTYQNANLLYSPLFGKYLLNSDSDRTKVLTQDDLTNIISITPAETHNAAIKISSVLEITILVTVIVVVISIVGNEVLYSM